MTKLYNLLSLSVLTFCNCISELILCRTCGSGVSSSNHIITKLSPESLGTFNDTLFNKDEVVVQTLLANFFFQYPIITVAQSFCVPVGKVKVIINLNIFCFVCNLYNFLKYLQWMDSDFYPDFYWKECVCAECGANIGWVFKPRNPYMKGLEPFFGLILYNLIGETCKYTFKLNDWVFGKVLMSLLNFNVCSQGDLEFYCLYCHKAFNFSITNKYNVDI